MSHFQSLADCNAWCSGRLSLKSEITTRFLFYSHQDQTQLFSLVTATETRRDMSSLTFLVTATETRHDRTSLAFLVTATETRHDMSSLAFRGTGP